MKSRPYTRGDFNYKSNNNFSHVFQVTPLHEGRPTSPGGQSAKYLISSHAPTRGATTAQCQTRLCAAYFKSRPYTRGDEPTIMPLLRGCYFKSRPYARGDRGSLCILGSISNFKSRPYARGDAGNGQPFQFIQNFKSRPYARGDRYAYNGLESEIFQVTPLYEGRPHHWAEHFHMDIFQVTPLYEGRPLSAQWPGVVPYFKSRPYTRGDTEVTIPFDSKSISSHAPIRGATSHIFGTLPLLCNFKSRPYTRGDSRGKP